MDDIPVGGPANLSDLERERLRKAAAENRKLQSAGRLPTGQLPSPVSTLEVSDRQALRPPDILRHDPSILQPVDNMPKDVRSRATTCPFSGRLLTMLPMGESFRLKGFSWTSMPFANTAAAEAALGTWLGMLESVPAVVYLRKDPWSGQDIEPVRVGLNGWQYRGEGWSSALFKSEENARHWFSIRMGKAPIFGPDALLAFKKEAKDADDDGNAAHLEELAAQKSTEEHLREEFDRRGLFSAPKTTRTTSFGNLLNLRTGKKMR
jgi:hypothetical protein